MSIKQTIKAILVLFKRRSVAPVFIVGCGHSGTSIMISLLDNHEDVYTVIGETSLFFKKRLEIYAKMHNWLKLAKLKNKSVVVEKTPSHIRKLDRIFNLFPMARVIIMLRDGRDVTCSIRSRTGDFDAAATKWVSENELAYAYWNHSQVEVVKLEDLTSKPEATIARVCQFLNIPFSDKILAKQGEEEKLYYTNKLTKEEDFKDAAIPSEEAHVNRRNWQINQGLFANTSRWEKDMSKQEIERFFELAESSMKLYGYV